MLCVVHRTCLQAELQRHTTFWKPVMVAILDELLRARAEAGKGLVFVLWGGYAQKLRKEVRGVGALCLLATLMQSLIRTHAALIAHSYCTPHRLRS